MNKAFTPSTVKIVSLNVWTATSPDRNYQAEREPLIKKFFAETLPDSFGVQECEAFWEERLSATVEGYTRAQELTTTKNYIYYRTDKYNLIDKGVFWLSETPDEISKGFGSRWFISCCYALLENKETGTRYVHVNTHIDVTSSTIRMKEIRVLIPRIEEMFGGTGYPIVLTGDFNCTEETAVIQQLFKNGYRDSRALAREKSLIGTFNNYIHYEPRYYRGPIDFVFVKGNVKVAKTDVVDCVDGKHISDHNAVVAEIELYA